MANITKGGLLDSETKKPLITCVKSNHFPNVNMPDTRMLIKFKKSVIHVYENFGTLKNVIRMLA